jgi:Family of unknown function (DUF5519)
VADDLPGSVDRLRTKSAWKPGVASCTIDSIGSEIEGATMSSTLTASRQITEEVTSWPGVEAAYGRRGEFAFKVGAREVGHLHGEHAAHFMFPKDVFERLLRDGRVVHHPVFPDRDGPAARRIDDQSDARDVIELMRLNYDRIAALREEAGLAT